MQDRAWRSSLKDLIIHLQLHCFKFKLVSLESVLVDTTADGSDMKCMAVAEMSTGDNSEYFNIECEILLRMISDKVLAVQDMSIKG